MPQSSVEVLFVTLQSQAATRSKSCPSPQAFARFGATQRHIVGTAATAGRRGGTAAIFRHCGRRKHVLHEQLRNAWRARERAVPISPAMHFASEGLILGAGTVVVAAEGLRRLRSLQGQEARLLALLSAAYSK